MTWQIVEKIPLGQFLINFSENLKRWGMSYIEEHTRRTVWSCIKMLHVMEMITMWEDRSRKAVLHSYKLQYYKCMNEASLWELGLSLTYSYLFEIYVQENTSLWLQQSLNSIYCLFWLCKKHSQLGNNDVLCTNSYGSAKMYLVGRWQIGSDAVTKVKDKTCKFHWPTALYWGEFEITNVAANVNKKLLLYLLGSNASAPPLDPPPGVLHANLSMYSSASKGSWEGGRVMSVLMVISKYNQQNT